MLGDHDVAKEVRGQSTGSCHNCGGSKESGTIVSLVSCIYSIISINMSFWISLNKKVFLTTHKFIFELNWLQSWYFYHYIDDDKHIHTQMNELVNVYGVSWNK